MGSNLLKSRQSLKPIRFEDELLPDWAQLLDLAASLVEKAAAEETCTWQVEGTDHASSEDDAGGDITLRRV